MNNMMARYYLKKAVIYLCTIMTVVICVFVLSALNSYAAEYSRIETDTVLNEGDILTKAKGMVNIDGSKAADGITLRVNGKIQIKNSVAVKGKVKIIGSNNAEFIAAEDFDKRGKRLICIITGSNDELSLENIKISANGNSKQFNRVGMLSVQEFQGDKAILNIENGVILNADSEDDLALKSYGTINVHSKPKIRGKVEVTEEIEFDPYIPDIEVRKLGASIISNADDPLLKGDTFTITVSLLPDKVLHLASGQLELSYDPDIFSLIGTNLSEAMSGLGEGCAAVTAENGRCTVHFNAPEGKSVKALSTGLELARLTFSADKVTESPVAFAVTNVTGREPGSDTDLEKLTPYPSLSMSVNPPMAVCEQYGSDYKIVKYDAKRMPESGKSYFIGDKEMIYVPAYSHDGRFAFVFLSTNTPENLIPETKNITRLKEGGSESETEVLKLERASGDINMNGITNIADAQIVVYMITNTVTSANETVDWLNSDVNGDGTINALDYQAIQHYVHYNSFG